MLCGLLGALLHPNPIRGLVIGLGTGSSAGWLGKVPAMERVDVVELEPAMREVARRCGAVNQRVLENPKVHLIIGDARGGILASREEYDVFDSEPSNPYRAGVASLFTKEFYRSSGDALARSADAGLRRCQSGEERPLIYAQPDKSPGSPAWNGKVQAREP